MLVCQCRGFGIVDRTVYTVLSTATRTPTGTSKEDEAYTARLTVCVTCTGALSTMLRVAPYCKCRRLPPVLPLCFEAGGGGMKHDDMYGQEHAL